MKDYKEIINYEKTKKTLEDIRIELPNVPDMKSLYIEFAKSLPSVKKITLLEIFKKELILLLIQKNKLNMKKIKKKYNKN